MKKYQIIKYNNFYAIANKEDLANYSKTGFLPYIKAMRFKKYLINLIKKDDKLKNDVTFKTIYIN